MSPPVRVTQLTDLHWLAKEGQLFFGVDPRRNFEAVLAAAAAEAPDAWIITGDLVHEPDAAVYETLAGRLLRPGGRVHAIPGNHDDPALMAEALPPAGVRLDDFALGDWRFLLLDSCVPGQVGGRVGSAALNRLETELDSAPQPLVAVAVHHPPIPVGAPWLDDTRLEDGDALLALLGRYPAVRVILTGHIHQAVDCMVDGIRILSAPATSVQFRPESAAFELESAMPGYRWLRLHQNGAVDTGIVRVSGAAGGVV